MTELEQTIDNVGHCALSLKSTVDRYVEALLAMKQQSLKCDADLAAKQDHANAQIASLRSDIAQLVEERREAERSLAAVRKEIQKEEKNIGREKERLRKSMDEWLAKQPQA